LRRSDFFGFAGTTFPANAQTIAWGKVSKQPFEVHLPEFVGRAALKPLRRRTWMLRLVDQPSNALISTIIS
jgi:hypothetical protein